ncbi:MAG: CHAT domain-containing protein [candidate division KSB1 bacterium]|nr:CHAT domain-containing protein [candidate division KSB1 bacterium]MDZ7367677.1 CHAT domain-containing protein [candidate division KSB1 bacterium]MDZ7404808.1 CHAT domain-containing protein [candidate division KSB1 bacterium]
MKNYLIAFFIAAALIAVAVWWLRDEATLAELQKQYLLAKNEAERAKIVERVESFISSFRFPDSIRQRVEQQVAAQIDAAKIALEEVAPDTNVYRLESWLQDLLRQAAIARARDENPIFQTLIKQTQDLAKKVDAETHNDYWRPFVEQVSSFTREEARTWLKARKAERLYREYSGLGRFKDAEFYAAYGLQLVQWIDDQRLYLDLIQRLQRVLCDYHAMYELSIALTQKPLLQAGKIKYHLRANGFLYYQAEAFFRMGENQAALRLFDAVSYNAEKLGEINDRQWFIKNSLLRKGDLYRELGEFEKAWYVCHEAEKLISDKADTVNLRLLEFNLFLATGYYEKAEEVLKNTIKLAEKLVDRQDLIMCYNNFGGLYARLTDYDLALAYYQRAQALFTALSPNLSTRLMVLANIADILAVKQDSAQLQQMIDDAKEFLRLAYNPYMEALLLSTVGVWHQLAENYHLAIEYYNKADSISLQNGYLRFALEKRIDRVDCLIALSRFDEAKTLLAETGILARRLNNLNRLINVLDRTAQIQYREGNIAQAIEVSNQLLYELEAMSSRFNNPDRLIAYRQKIYDAHKNAVLYEIALQRNEAAFVKLDAAKAYALKNRLLNQQADGEATNGKPHHSDFVSTRLRPGQLLLDYMIKPDTLYVFVLDQNGLRLRRKKIDSRVLQQMTRAYRDSINRSPRLFQKHDANFAKAHYTGTLALSEKLYQELLGWPEITARLPQTYLLYIIPDEFLYEVPFSTLIANRSEAQTFLVNHTAVLASPSVSLLPAENLAAAVSKRLNTLKALISADKRFPGAEKFVTKIKELFPRAEELIVQGGNVTKDQVLAQLQQGYRVYIFVGHGQANSQYPDQGYIELAVKTSKAAVAKTIRLTMADLKTINWLGAEMVMLVGCETAGGKLYRGAGISGLQQEFLALGAKNVLGNLWEVDATYAIPQAQDFLATWAATWDLPRALQASQRQTMQTLQESRYYQLPHPYFWGSTILLTATHH